MADRADITPELLRQLLRYEPDSGKIFWLERGAEIHPDIRIRNAWNTRYAGKQAGSINAKGYISIEVLKFEVRAHRIAWAIHHGEWPKNLIDHVNGVKNDNRINNLRDVDAFESAKNRGKQKNNSSGFNGVTSRNGKWRVTIAQGKKKMSVGTFTNLDDAIAARKDAEARLGFHPNHGRSG